MLFVVDKPKLQRMINMTRDDRGRGRQGDKAPYFRIEASDDGWVKLTGREMEADVSATVYEPGVLFLKVTTFRQLLKTFRGEKTMTFQVNQDGLMFGDVRMGLEAQDMLLYADPNQAPQEHPGETMSRKEQLKAEIRSCEQGILEHQDRLKKAREELQKLMDSPPAF